mmetsp:Transcript_23681/g.70014  ORF Transcript_23681/g.70014 Transcript_23681/m.70014 type:complete len:259 (-) Transcript_23681:122-898(-)
MVGRHSGAQRRRGGRGADPAPRLADRERQDQPALRQQRQLRGLPLAGPPAAARAGGVAARAVGERVQLACAVSAAGRGGAVPRLHAKRLRLPRARAGVPRLRAVQLYRVEQLVPDGRGEAGASRLWRRGPRCLRRLCGGLHPHAGLQRRLSRRRPLGGARPQPGPRRQGGAAVRQAGLGLRLCAGPRHRGPLAVVGRRHIPIRNDGAAAAARRGDWAVEGERRAVLVPDRRRGPHGAARRACGGAGCAGAAGARDREG